jgi:hypothetical protein
MVRKNYSLIVRKNHSLKRFAVKIRKLAERLSWKMDND